MAIAETDPLPIDLDALEALLAKATPGPWHTGAGDHWSRDVRAGSDAPAFCGARNGVADAALIVAAVNALPALIAELRAARRERDALREAAKPAAICHAPTRCFGTSGFPRDGYVCPGCRLDAALRTGGGHE